MTYHTRESFTADVELTIAQGRATLNVIGRRESRSVDLARRIPSRGPSTRTFSDEWTGTARRVAGAWVIHFDQTTASVRDPNFDWRCEAVEAEVAGRSRSAWRCASAQEISWGPPGRPVPSYFRVPIHLSRVGLRNDVQGSYGHPTTVRLSDTPAAHR
ncbi:MAG: hypothetical protein AAGE52_10610 [Myxococcota bacterium]